MMEPAALYFMPVYQSGVRVQWQQRQETISHVMVRRTGLMVYLVGHEQPVHPDALQVEPSAFQLSRAP